MLHAAILASPHAHARIRGYDIARGAGAARRRRGRDRRRFRRPPHGRLHQGRTGRSPRARCAMSASRSPPSRPRTRRRRAPRCAADRGRLRGAAGGAVAGGGAGARRADRPRGPGRLLQGVRRRLRRQPRARARAISEGDVEPPGRNATSSSRTSSRRRRRPISPSSPAARWPRSTPAGRVTLWSANQSVFRVQANVCEVARPADVAAALPDAAGRRRLRQQDGGPRPADRRGAGAGDRPAGEADPVARGGFRDGARPPSLQDPDARPAPGATARWSRARSRCCWTAAPTPTTARACWATPADGARALSHPASRAAMAVSSIPTSCASAPSAASAIRRSRFAGESQIDEIAERLGIDPIELRLKNAMRARRPLVRRPAGRAPTASSTASTKVRDTLAAGSDRQAKPAPPGKRRGFGVACRRPYQRPAGDRRHRAHARGRHRRAQHRRRRYRPGLRHRADARSAPRR